MNSRVLAMAKSLYLGFRCIGIPGKVSSPAAEFQRGLKCAKSAPQVSSPSSQTSSLPCLSPSAGAAATIHVMFIHCVYFWLSDDADDVGREKMLADCTELLGKIPTVRHVWAGTPAMTPRDIVD